MWSATARGLNAAADLASNVSDAMGTILTVGSNATVQVARLATAVSESGLCLAQEAWSGVDVLNISATCEQGRILSDDSEGLASYLATPLGRATVHLPERFLIDALAAVASVSYRIPSIELERRFINISGDFESIHIRAQLVNRHFIGMSWRSSAVTFEARWANPFWEALEVDVGTEEEQILQRVLALVQPLFHSFGPLRGHDDWEAAEAFWFLPRWRRWTKAALQMLRWLIGW